MRTFLFLLVLVMVGCQPSAKSPTVDVSADSSTTSIDAAELAAEPAAGGDVDGDVASSTTATAPAGRSTEASSASVDIQLASWEETQELIAARRGKVVVIDVWSTWCVPCVREFPKLVELQKRFPEQVSCMSLNCNYAGIPDEPAESLRPEIEKFLTEQQARFTNVICTDADEKLFEKLGVASIPVVRVYDKQGQFRQQFVNDDNEYGEEGFTYERHIVPLVEKLTAE